MNRERLLALADFLETKVPENQFNMSVLHNGKDPHTCRFAGCAMGWAAVLWPEYFEFTETSIYLKDSLILGSKAMEEFFDIDYIAVNRLFYRVYNNNGNKLTAKQVANRIREYVNNEVQEA